MTAQAVQANFGSPLTPAQETQVDLWLSQVRGYILAVAEAQGVTVDASLVDLVLVEVVTARLHNPGGATQTDVQIDDARVSHRYGSGSALGVAPHWWRLLGLRDPDAPASGAFSVRPGFEPDWSARPSEQ